METIKEVFKSFTEISHLSNSPAPHVHLNRFTELFMNIRNSYDFKKLASHIHWQHKYPSHVKACLYQEDFHYGTLKLELIRFEAPTFTTLHTHPAILIDEVLEGTLLEKNYIPNTQKPILFEDLLRSTGDKRSIYAPNGHPHKVRAISDYCLNLCLSFGQKPEIPLKEEL